jgi:hypothetical protein
MFENALREVSGDDTIALPYWDWTDAASTDAVFSDDMMGPEGDPAQDYAVTSGPFAKGVYELRVLDPETVQGQIAPQDPFLVRRFGAYGDTTVELPTKADVRDTVAAPIYDTPPWDANSSSRCWIGRALSHSSSCSVGRSSAWPAIRLARTIALRRCAASCSASAAMRAVMVSFGVRRGIY